MSHAYNAAAARPLAIPAIPVREILPWAIFTLLLALFALYFVGAETTAQLATSALRKGGRYVVVGLYGGELRLPLPFIPMLGLSIAGSYVGTLDEMHRLLALAGAGRLPAIPITRRKLREVNAALDDLAAGRVAGRIVLEPT